MNYRPICDVWILARSKVRYYGAYPSGFVERGRALLGVTINDAVLHVCAGRVRDYPFRGVGPNDKTLDIDSIDDPDFIHDAREPLPLRRLPDPTDTYSRHGASPPLVPWDGIMADRPYTPEDAEHYTAGAEVLPGANALLKNCLQAVRVGGRVGFLDYILPKPPKWAKFIACVMVVTGYNNRVRVYSVYERME